MLIVKSPPELAFEGVEAAHQPEEVLAHLLLETPDRPVFPPGVLIGGVGHDP